MNTISENLQRLVNAKTSIANAITAKGGTVNEGDGFEDFATDIDSIPTGGVEYTDRVGRGTMNITSISKISQPLKNYYPESVIPANPYILTTPTSSDGKQFYGRYIWTDGENTYYSNGSTQYVLNKETDTWETKTWTGLTSFTGNDIWTVDDDIYYSYGSSQYILDKTTSTWSTKTWSGLTDFDGNNIWTYNNDVYYSYGSSQYVLDKATSTWNKSSIPSMTSGSYNIGGNAIWTDGCYICYTYVSGSYSTYYTFSNRLNKDNGSWVSYTPFPRVQYSSYRNLNPAIWSDGIYTYAQLGGTYILPRYVAPYS